MIAGLESAWARHGHPPIQWADDVRLSDVEPRFVCKACGKRGPTSARTLSLRGWGSPTEALQHQQSHAQKDNRKHAQDNSDSDGRTVIQTSV
jgi:hypothetical protein